MGDAKKALTISATIVGIWSLFFALGQIGVMIWQMPEINRRREYWQDRQLPSISGIDPFRSKFPGLYKRYSDAPERRKYLALFVIQICMMVAAILQLAAAAVLLYGVRKERKAPLAIWFLVTIPNVLLALAYSVIWWAGDVFNEHLTLSVLEFLAAMINCVSMGVIVLFYMRLSGIPLFGPIHSPPFPAPPKEKNLEGTNKRKHPSNSPKLRPTTLGGSAYSQAKEPLEYQQYRPMVTHSVPGPPNYAQQQSYLQSVPPQTNQQLSTMHYQAPTRQEVMQPQRRGINGATPPRNYVQQQSLPTGKHYAIPANNGHMEQRSMQADWRNQPYCNNQPPHLTSGPPYRQCT